MCNGEGNEDDRNKLKRHCYLLQEKRWSCGSYMETDS
jgi:hypothetical protein